MVASITGPAWPRALPWVLVGLAAQAQTFQLPTANRALFEKNGEERFFVGTVGKPWMSGAFGCVRSEGWQMHEGIDIRCLQRDKRGEPTDPVLATADGTVAYISTRPSLSNYGNYIVLRHQVEGIELYSLYAHLREVRHGLKPGQAVKAGEPIAVMGRTANTQQTISKDRAHLHFELNLVINDRYAAWHKRTMPNQRNDHGQWNGQNLLALDPRAILLQEHDLGSRFSLLSFLQHQTELCRVVVRKTDFPWLQRYRPLVRADLTPHKEAVAGYEIALNFNGVPFELIPRSAAEIKTKSKFPLLFVNEAEYRKNPGRRLVTRKGTRWELATPGFNLLDLLTY
jgi:peptidoglycan LD-endopeptidase LytH